MPPQVPVLLVLVLHWARLGLALTAVTIGVLAGLQGPVGVDLHRLALEQGVGGDDGLDDDRADQRGEYGERHDGDDAGLSEVTGRVLPTPDGADDPDSERVVGTVHDGHLAQQAP